MRIFVSALEHSADLYLADLVRSLRARQPDAEVFGLAGPAAMAAGCRSLQDMTGKAAMLNHAVARGPDALMTLSRLDRAFSYDPPDLAILLDSPTFNLPLARRLKSRRVPVYYYIAPQVWAWAKFRVHKVRNRTDAVGCILPFEQDFFRPYGVNATFIGHPLLDRLRAIPIDQGQLQQVRSIGQPLVALMPGSRRHVIESVLPDMLHCAKRVRRQHPAARFVISCARPDVLPLIQEICQKAGATDVPILSSRNAEILTAADLVIVASGTATLEVAYYGKPMIVCYKGNKIMYWAIAYWLIRTKYLSLVNILANQRLVPEFMPYYTNPEPIAQEALELLANEQLRQKVSTRLAEIMATLDKPGVADRVAKVALELAESRKRRRNGPTGSRSRLW
jgi:lipid-A-disaccharide synthase